MKSSSFVLKESGCLATLNKKVVLRGQLPYRSDIEGTLTLKPSEKRGIFFCANKKTIAARISQTKICDEHTTTLIDGNVEIKSVEHLLSVFAGLGIDNCIVELKENQIPFVMGDSSAKVLTDKILGVGIRRLRKSRTIAIVKREIYFTDGSGSLAILRPAESSYLSALIQFSPPIGEQYFRFDFTPENYYNQICWARSFFRSNCEGEYWQYCRTIFPSLPRNPAEQKLILAFREGRWLVKPKTRNEPVRHKILDALGDLLLLGYPIQGEITFIRPGHAFNRKLVLYLASLVK